MQVAVCGPGEATTTDEALARRVGELLAARGDVVICGGGNGVMAAVAAGARSRGGLVVGVRPGGTRDGASPDLDVTIVTNLGEARNAVIVWSADAVIAVGGSWGTLSEVALAMRRGGIPVVVLAGWRVVSATGVPLPGVRYVDTPEAAVAATAHRSDRRNGSRVPSMRTLHVGLRVSDLERSLEFYTAVGYRVIGTVEGTAFGSLTMLRLPCDDFVTIELVHDRAKGDVDLGTGINHLVIQVGSLDATLSALAANGIAAEPPELPGGADGPRTSWLTDPDGYRIELVQWPAGHADGLTEADFA